MANFHSRSNCHHRNLMTGEKGEEIKPNFFSSQRINRRAFDFAFSSFKLWSEEITTRIIPIGETLAEKVKMVLKFNVSALIFSFGYLIGLRLRTDNHRWFVAFVVGINTLSKRNWELHRHIKR